jgi:hypothetical protein
MCSSSVFALKELLSKLGIYSLYSFHCSIESNLCLLVANLVPYCVLTCPKQKIKNGEETHDFLFSAGISYASGKN